MADRSPRTVIVAVGDELLGGYVLDTNSHWLAGRVRDVGYEALRIEVIGDSVTAIRASIGRAVQDRSVARVLVAGGLGPTPDDRTLEGLAAALGRPLETDERALAHVRGIVARMHRAGWLDRATVGEANLRMTAVPRGALVLENRRGMAPGLAYPLPAPRDAGADAAGPSRATDAVVAAGSGGEEVEERWLVALPGVPRELRTIVDEEVLPRFFTGGVARAVAEACYPMAIEADFFEPMRAVEREFPDVAVGSYPQSETRELLLRVHGADPERVQAALGRLRQLHEATAGRPGANANAVAPRATGMPRAAPSRAEGPEAAGPPRRIS